MNSGPEFNRMNNLAGLEMNRMIYSLQELPDCSFYLFQDHCSFY